MITGKKRQETDFIRSAATTGERNNDKAQRKTLNWAKTAQNGTGRCITRLLGAAATLDRRPRYKGGRRAELMRAAILILGMAAQGGKGRRGGGGSGSRGRENAVVP